MVSLAVTAFAILTVGIPLWAVVVNSFKGVAEASDMGLGLPTEWHLLENYSTVIIEGRLFNGLRNTLLVVVPSTIAIVFLSAAASWVLGRSRRGSTKVLYYVAISGILIPTAIVTTIQVLRWMGLHQTHLGLVLFYVGTSVSVGIFLGTGFVKTIPIELEEAARIDGAGPLTVFRRIILPLLTPILATLTFLMIMFLWNDVFSQFFLLSRPNDQTLMLGLFSFVSRHYRQTEWQLVFADVVLVSLPLVIFFVLAQRWVVSGIMGVGRDK